MNITRPNASAREMRLMTKAQSIKELMTIPSIGKSIAVDLWNIGIRSVDDLKAKVPEVLYDLSNRYVGAVQDRRFSQ
jgi:hypothetical protein